MDHLGLSGRLAQVSVGRLSAGQRRRTALAVLVARRPELWLLDEPHAGLDSAGRDVVDGLIVAAAKAGATVLFASHELDRAEALAPRSVTIVGGTVTDDTSASPGAPAVALSRTVLDTSGADPIASGAGDVEVSDVS
jgi:ABC-type multidrug transport system ATPase subunit